MRLSEAQLLRAIETTLRSTGRHCQARAMLDVYLAAGRLDDGNIRMLAGFAGLDRTSALSAMYGAGDALLVAALDFGLRVGHFGVVLR